MGSLAWLFCLVLSARLLCVSSLVLRPTEGEKVTSFLLPDASIHAKISVDLLNTTDDKEALTLALQKATELHLAIVMVKLLPDDESTLNIQNVVSFTVDLVLYTAAYNETHSSIAADLQGSIEWTNDPDTFAVYDTLLAVYREAFMTIGEVINLQERYRREGTLQGIQITTTKVESETLKVGENSSVEEETSSTSSDNDTTITIAFVVLILFVAVIVAGVMGICAARCVRQKKKNKKPIQEEPMVSSVPTDPVLEEEDMDASAATDLALKNLETLSMIEAEVYAELQAQEKVTRKGSSGSNPLLLLRSWGRGQPSDIEHGFSVDRTRLTKRDDIPMEVFSYPISKKKSMATKEMPQTQIPEIEKTVIVTTIADNTEIETLYEVLGDKGDDFKEPTHDASSSKLSVDDLSIQESPEALSALSYSIIEPTIETPQMARESKLRKNTPKKESPRNGQLLVASPRQAPSTGNKLRFSLSYSASCLGGKLNEFYSLPPCSDDDDDDDDDIIHPPKAIIPSDDYSLRVVGVASDKSNVKEKHESPFLRLWNDPENEMTERDNHAETKTVTESSTEDAKQADIPIDFIDEFPLMDERGFARKRTPQELYRAASTDTLGRLRKTDIEVTERARNSILAIHYERMEESRGNEPADRMRHAEQIGSTENEKKATDTTRETTSTDVSEKNSGVEWSRVADPVVSVSSSLSNGTNFVSKAHDSIYGNDDLVECDDIDSDDFELGGENESSDESSAGPISRLDFETYAEDRTRITRRFVNGVQKNNTYQTLIL